jgi:hypothetical protein
MKPKYPRKLAGVIVVRRVIAALYQDGIMNGTGGWNTTLSEIAPILLLSALEVRAGDILTLLSRRKDRR